MDAWDEGVPATALREISVLKEVCIYEYFEKELQDIYIARYFIHSTS